jgi:hypothetical protein
MKLVSNLVLGVMLLMAVLGLVVVVGSMVVGDFKFSEVNNISLNGELG